LLESLNREKVSLQQVRAPTKAVGAQLLGDAGSKPTLVLLDNPNRAKVALQQK